MSWEGRKAGTVDGRKGKRRRRRRRRRKKKRRGVAGRAHTPHGVRQIKTWRRSQRAVTTVVM